MVTQMDGIVWFILCDVVVFFCVFVSLFRLKEGKGAIDARRMRIACNFVTYIDIPNVCVCVCVWNVYGTCLN